MGIRPYVIHDEDSGTPRAEVFNLPIAEALGGEIHRTMLHNCIEDVLGYSPSDTDKPYKAYQFIGENWGNDWTSIPSAWRTILERVFAKSFLLENTTP